MFHFWQAIKNVPNLESIILSCCVKYSIREEKNRNRKNVKPENIFLISSLLWEAESR